MAVASWAHSGLLPGNGFSELPPDGESSSSLVRPSPSRNEWASLLEQASELNDELCRENCDLHREVALLRQTKQDKEDQLRALEAHRAEMFADGPKWRSARASNLLPRVMSHLRRALAAAAAPAHLDWEALVAATEEAVRMAIAATARLPLGEEARASNEETAALVTEKMALKEFSIRQQERLLQLELAKERVLANPGNWASRLTSALQASLEPAALAPSTPLTPRDLPKIHPPGTLCEVVGKKGAIIRAEIDLASEQVAMLPPGSRVVILEVGDQDGEARRRAKVKAMVAVGSVAEEGDSAHQEVFGWLSVTAKDGKVLVRPVLDGGDAPEAAAPSQRSPTRGPAEVEAAPGAAASSADTGTVTVSTSAWLALRDERVLRDRQIRAIQGQVEAAQKDVEQLAEVRQQLRQKRGRLLENRQRCTELLEVSRMISEEIAAVRAQVQRSKVVDAAAPPAEPTAEEEEAAIEEGEEETAMAEEGGGGTRPRTRLEWQRLLSERETTADELGLMLVRAEELEREVENKRVQLQLVERRRERERVSLLTALRELGGSADDGTGYTTEADSTSAPDSETPQTAAALLAAGLMGAASLVTGTEWSPATASRAEASSPASSFQAERPRRVLPDGWEREYLERISDLEVVVQRLTAQLDEVHVRVTDMNKSAVVRASALREAVASASSGVAAAAMAQGQGPRAPAAASAAGNRQTNAETEAMAEMLDRLFVENHALQSTRSSASASSQAQARPSGKTLDLSRFVIQGGSDSEEESRATAQGGSGPSSASFAGRRGPVPAAAPSPAPPPTPPAPPPPPPPPPLAAVNSAPRAALSPQDLLKGFDFDTSVAE